MMLTSLYWWAHWVLAQKFLVWEERYCYYLFLHVQFCYVDSMIKICATVTEIWRIIKGSIGIGGCLLHELTQVLNGCFMWLQGWVQWFQYVLYAGTWNAQFLSQYFLYTSFEPFPNCIYSKIWYDSQFRLLQGQKAGQVDHLLLIAMAELWV